MTQTVSPRQGATARWLPVHRVALTPQRESDWRPLAAGGASQRDIELAAASDNIILSRHLRAGSLPVDLNAVATQPRCHFYWLYVVRGTLILSGGKEGSVTLEAGDCVHQPDLLNTHKLELAPGSQALEIAVPVNAGREAPPLHSYPLVLNIEKKVGYTQGEGLRKYFAYRDLGVAAATGDKILLHIIRATAPSPAGGTGWHRHNISQMIFLTDGWVDLSIKGMAPFRMHAGDTLCMSCDTEHVVTAFSADYVTIEMCIPAHYDTVDVPVPKGFWNAAMRRGSHIDRAGLAWLPVHSKKV